MSDRTDVIADANEFFLGGQEQLGHIALGENEAKIGMLVTMAMGRDMLLIGPAGGCKTTLARDSYRLLQDVYEEDVAVIPVQSDLQPQQLIGGTLEVTKSTTYDDQTVTEKTTTDINPIIKSDTRVIFANEINRISPLAINSILEALETGVMDTSKGKIALKGLEYVVSTMNPNESTSGTFPMAAATASRHEVGVILGNEIGNDESRRRKVRGIMIDGFEPDPDAIVPILNTQQLRAIRQEAKRTPIPRNLEDRSIDLAIATNEALKDLEKYDFLPVVEADGRMSKQIAVIAKTLSFLEAQNRVGESQLRQAVKFIITGRMGALSRGTLNGINDVYNAVVD